MKITLTRKEVTKILVDNLIMNGRIANDSKEVSVTYTIVNEDEDGFSVTVEAHYETDYDIHDHCPRCGQKFDRSDIDWSEEDNEE